jgi:hypothetical protein
MERCDECGTRNLAPVVLEGLRVLECGLCGALAGDDHAVSRLLHIREARESGIHPDVYPLIRVLGKILHFTVVSSHGGDAEARVWPFVQMGIEHPDAIGGLENLAKSLAMSARGHDIHWVIEVEYRHRLVFTLKPRFHRDPDRIGPDLVRAARADMERIRRNLERDMRLGWWRESQGSVP